MVKNQYIIIAVISLFTGIIVYFSLFQSNEAKVKKQFYFIAEKIEKLPGESPLVAAANANRLNDVIAGTCKIIAPSYSISKTISPKDFSSFVLLRRLQFSEIAIKFYDFVIDFPEENVSLVNVTERMEGKLKNGETVGDFHELKCRLQKIEDVWKFVEVEVVEVLRR